MNSAASLARTKPPLSDSPRSGFRSIFEHAPFAAARCTSQGIILEANSAFRRSFDPEDLHPPMLRFADLLPSSDRATVESCLHDLFACNLESVRLQLSSTKSENPQKTFWTAWRVSASGEESMHALLIADHAPEKASGTAPSLNFPDLNSQGLNHEDSLLQAQRWEAVGRLAGGVVHDFNNLLTGIMLYTDLLLSSIDARDRRRRYADEIRTAIIQASGLIRQLLVFARPQKIQLRALSLNQIAEDMKGLLTRLMGENFTLEFRLDPDLGLLKIDQAQAQQIILNLILNARDAMPNGGRIVLTTSNCRFQSVAAIPGPLTVPAFPCILFTVADQGCGMDENIRQRLFEPFFTTKNAGKGTGLGLTTVRSIVTTYRGLIHVESEVGRGTRVMIVFPRASQSADAVFMGAEHANFDSIPTSFQTSFQTSLQTSPQQPIKKEVLP